MVFHDGPVKLVTFPRAATPDEAHKTNVVGTYNVLQAAKEVGVSRFANISTDKAADPTSYLGFTNGIAERLTATVAEEAPGTYLSVRLGNVLGSRGSVLTAFRLQTDVGVPLTVTHPDVTRYFMTVAEVVELVIQVGAIGSDGDELVLDIGSPCPHRPCREASGREGTSLHRARAHGAAAGGEAARGAAGCCRTRRAARPPAHLARPGPGAPASGVQWARGSEFGARGER